MNHIKFIKSFICEEHIYFVFEFKLKGAFKYHYAVCDESGAVLRVYSSQAHAFDFILNFCF